MTAEEQTNQEQPEAGEQMTLLDVGPEQSKKLLALAKEYKKQMQIRVEALAAEIAAKGEILDYIHAENLTPVEGGKIKFELDGVKFTVTPRDELLQVKFAKEEDSAE